LKESIQKSGSTVEEFMSFIKTTKLPASK